MAQSGPLKRSLLLSRSYLTTVYPCCQVIANYLSIKFIFIAKSYQKVEVTAIVPCYLAE
jgi:hypothetical protein